MFAWEQRKLGESCKSFIDGDWIESKDQSESGVRLLQTGNVGITNFIEKDNKNVEYLVKNAFSKEAANIIKEDLIQVVEDSEGTAKDMKVIGRTIAGKTGTAELKASKDGDADVLGWFDCFTTDSNDNQLLIISIVENGRSLGGSHYLIKKIKTLF